MRIIEELLCEDIGRNVLEMLEFCKGDFIETADAKAVEVLEKIKIVLYRHEELSDFEIVEEIVNIFGKYNIHTGGCHDFG
ncbi:MAG: hypothetical protein ACI4A5_01480 [Hominilimicola sp.]